MSYILKNACIPCTFLVINVCSQGKTLCSPCISLLTFSYTRKSRYSVTGHYRHIFYHWSLSPYFLSPSLSPYFMSLVTIVIFSVTGHYRHIFCHLSLSPYFLSLFTIAIFSVTGHYRHIFCHLSLSPYFLSLVTIATFSVTFRYRHIFRLSLSIVIFVAI